MAKKRCCRRGLWETPSLCGDHMALQMEYPCTSFLLEKRELPPKSVPIGYLTPVEKLQEIITKAA